MAELRWNPLLGEWVATARGREPSAPRDVCPYCPSAPGGPATEIPAETFAVAVLEQRRALLAPEPPEPTVAGSELTPVHPSRGVCEVVVYTPDHGASLADQRLDRVELLVKVWTDRYNELGHLPYARYVLIYEDRSSAAGAEARHPHGVVCAYPFVPPVPAREVARSREHTDRTGRCLVCDVLDEERRDARRIVLETPYYLAYVPFFSWRPFEVHVTPKRHVQSLAELRPREVADLARALKPVLAAYERLGEGEAPYTLVVHQRPTDGQDYGYYHLHVELWQPESAACPGAGAGNDLGGGVYVNSMLPEDAAARMRSQIPGAEGEGL